MRRAVAFLVIVAIGSLLVAGRKSTYDTASYRGGSGASAGVTVRASLSENGAAPEIFVTANVGIDIAVAASAALSSEHPWNDDIAWGANVASDTTEAEADGRHVVTGFMTGTGQEGDTVSVNVRLYASSTAFYDTTAVLILDATGVRKVWAWCGNELVDAAPDSGFSYAAADTDLYDRVLKDNTGKTMMRYCAPMRAYPDSVDQWYRGMRPTGKIEDNGVWATAPDTKIWMPFIWYNMKELPYYAKIVKARLVFSIMEYGDMDTTGGYVAVRLDTVAADLPWITTKSGKVNPSYPDSLYASSTWNYVDPANETPWSPPLDDRDDWHDYGPRSDTTVKRKFAVVDVGQPTHAFQIDVTDAVQQYCDRGPDRVNAGFVLYGSFANWSNGFCEISAGRAATSVRGSPQLIVEWVDGLYNVPAWGVGGVPFAITLDDCSDDHLAMGGGLDSVGFNWTEVVSQNNVGTAGNLTAVQLDAQRLAGVDMALHTRSHIVVGNLDTPQKLFNQLGHGWVDSTWASASPIDTTATEWADFAYPAGGGLAYTITGIQQLQQYGYRSGRGYGFSTDDSVGSVTSLKWDSPSNIYAFAATSEVSLKDDTYAATYEKVMTVVDTYYNNDRAAVVLLQHYLDGVLGHFTAPQWSLFCRVLGDIDCAPVVTLEYLISQRYAASDFVTPTEDFAAEFYLTGDPWADAVWLGACSSRETTVAP